MAVETPLAKQQPPTLKSSWADECEEDLEGFPLSTPATPAKPKSVSAPKQPTYQADKKQQTQPNRQLAPRNDRWKKDEEWHTVGGKNKHSTTQSQPHSQSQPQYQSQSQSQPQTRADVTWESSLPVPKDTTTAPELYARSSFLVGVQKFTDETLKAHLIKHGVDVADVRITRTERNGLRPFALLIARAAGPFRRFMDDESVSITNHLLPENPDIQFRSAEPYVPRDDQDPYSIIIKGSSATVEQVRQFFVVLGEPRSITISSRCGATFVRWDNPLAPYMAVEVFAMRNFGGRSADIRIRRA